MATRKVTTSIFVCDFCATEDESVQTHDLRVDGTNVRIELCGKDWGKVEKVLAPVYENGRRPKRGGATTKNT